MKKIIIESKTYGTFEVLVDDEDYERLMEHKWYAAKLSNGKFYIMIYSHTDSNGKQKKIYMHSLITNAPI